MIKHLLNAIKKPLFIFKLMLLKRKARKISRFTNDRVYILKCNGLILIITRRQFKEAKHKGIFPVTFTQEHLTEIALYKYQYHVPYKVSK